MSTSASWTISSTSLLSRPGNERADAASGIRSVSRSDFTASTSPAQARTNTKSSTPASARPPFLSRAIRTLPLEILELQNARGRSSKPVRPSAEDRPGKRFPSITAHGAGQGSLAHRGQGGFDAILGEWKQVAARFRNDRASLTRKRDLIRRRPVRISRRASISLKEMSFARFLARSSTTCSSGRSSRWKLLRGSDHAP
jgi:hypothetical protein